MKKIFMIISFCLLTTNSLAQMEIHPRLTLEQEYTDNLFLDDNNEQEDWISTIEPGLSLTYDSRSVDVSVDYSLRYVFYQDNDDRNIDDFEDVQRADSVANFFAGRPFTVAINQSITREALDERDVFSDDNDLVNRTTVYNLQVIPEYRLALTPTFSLVLGYTYDRVDYTDSAGNDSEEHIGRLSAVKELSSNTSISAAYAYTVHQDDTDEDFDQQDYTLGLDQQVGPRLSLSAEVGWSTVEYDDGRDEDDINWLLSSAYRLTEALTFSANFSQAFETSATDGLTTSRLASLGLEYAKNDLTGSAELFWENTDYARTAREDDAYGTRIALSVPMSVAFSSSFDAEYEKASFDDVTDEDVDRFAFGAALNYEYRRILASLGYRYRLNDSDVNANDYTNNIITLSATLRF